MRYSEIDVLKLMRSIRKPGVTIRNLGTYYGRSSDTSSYIIGYVFSRVRDNFSEDILMLYFIRGQWVFTSYLEGLRGRQFLWESDGIFHLWAVPSIPRLRNDPTRS